MDSLCEALPVSEEKLFETSDVLLDQGDVRRYEPPDKCGKCEIVLP